jgi:hypothetical protein
VHDEIHWGCVGWQGRESQEIMGLQLECNDSGGASSSWSERPGVDVQGVLKVDLVELSGGGAEEARPA